MRRVMAGKRTVLSSSRTADRYIGLIVLSHRTDRARGAGAVASVSPHAAEMIAGASR